jgi:hypothetical protein
MPPVTASVELKAMPTFAASIVVVIAGAAGTAMVAVDDLEVSATDVAVTVAESAELEAAGAV